MSELGERPSSLLELGFRVPVWMHTAHLGAVFGGRIGAVVHHGRKSWLDDLVYGRRLRPKDTLNR